MFVSAVFSFIEKLKSQADFQQGFKDAIGGFLLQCSVDCLTEEGQVKLVSPGKSIPWE